jgi:cyclophilin family peptidyl-prolyl cis-trans isomerase
MVGRKPREVAPKRTWRSRGTQLLMAGLPMAILATGCGAAPPLQIAAVGTASPAATRAHPDACWTDDQRVEGDDTMPQQYSQQPTMRIDPAKSYTGVLQTNKGTIEVEFFPGDAPVTVNNFVCLAEDGYFDNTPFHRIVKGFVIQGGDPTGTGSGGPGYQFADEPIAREYERGTLAMANAGPNTNGSQFFVVLEDLRGKLPKNYTIFGRVTEGMDVVEEIANTPTRTGRSGENSTPTEPVTLEKVTISES